MTLNTRNKILLTFFYIACFILLALLIITVYQFIQHKFTNTPLFNRLISLSEKYLLTKNSPRATILSIFILLLYVPISILFIYLTFEKTKSPETIYLSGFLLGCLLQCSRIFIILFDLWSSTSSILLFLGKVDLVGRIFSILCLFLTAVFSDQELVQDADRNISVTLGISLLCGIMIPVNTLDITSCFTIATGFDKLIRFFITLVSVITIAAFFINSYKRNLKLNQQSAPYFVLLLLGYFTVTFCDNYLFAIIGSILLIIGTRGIILSLHNYYIWK